MPPASIATCCKTEQVFLHERRIYSITHHRSHEEGCLVAARTVPVRLARLLCPDLTPCTKLVAVGLQMDRHLKQEVLRSPSRLRRRLGPSRTTIRKAFAALKGPCRPQVPNDLIALSRLQVRVPKALITDKALPAQARVIYCILLGLHRLKRFDILSSFRAIARVVRLQARTVRRAVYALEQAGWLGIAQKNKHAPIRFSFPDPVQARQNAEVRRAKQYLKHNGLVGESLTRLWLDTLVVPSHYMDNCYPEFLINPTTNELLQADRYYVDYNVIVEFNGPQHDGATELFSHDEAQAQMERDRIKRQICARHKVPFIEVRPEDLTFDQLHELVDGVMPLLERRRDEPVVLYLEQESRRYRRIIADIRRKSGQVL